MKYDVVVILIILCGSFNVMAQPKSSKKNSQEKTGASMSERSENSKADKKIGLGYTVESLGYGLNANFTYLQTTKVYLEGSIGYSISKKNEVVIDRIPLMLGAKYKLYQVSDLIYFYGGGEVAITKQMIKNIIPSHDHPSIQFGGNAFGEIIFNLKYKISAGLRYNHQMVFNDKVYKQEGESALILSNFGFVVRKTL